MREKLIDVLKDTRANAAWHHWGYEESADYLIANDVVPVVLCKDCKHSYEGVANIMCGRCGQNINGIRLGGVSVKEEHFCSYGERKDNDT